MRRSGWMKTILRATTTTAALAGLLVTAGCQSGLGSSRPKVARSSDSSVTTSGDVGSGYIAEKTPPPSRSVAANDVVDRHPLFYKPREIYEKSGSNTAVKIAGATLVGVPMGIYGELKQIVVGTPQPKTY